VQLPSLPDNRRTEALELARDAWRRASAAVRRTPGLLALSFLLGISLWVFISDTENPTVVDFFPTPIPVEAVNVGDALAVANQLAPVDVRVAAPTDSWQELTSANFRAFVDLKGFDARSQEVTVQVEVIGVRGVRVVDTAPRSIVVNLEDLVSREVPVRARSVGSPPLGYELGAMTPSAASVLVFGPESLVNLVSEAVAEINVTGLTVGVDQSVSLKPQGSGGAEIRGVRLEPAGVRLAVDVIQSTVVRTVPLSAAVIGEPEPGYRVSAIVVSPAAVQVRGPIEVLQQLDEIRLPSVNIARARTDLVRSVSIPLPAGLEFVGQERATVTVNVGPAEGSLRTTLFVAVTNVPQNHTARAEPANVEVVLQGPLPLINAFVASDARAVVDVGGRSGGSVDLPVSVTAPEGVIISLVTPSTVTVTITALAQ
jgi:YbbR domain-containing protein